MNSQLAFNGDFRTCGRPFPSVVAMGATIAMLALGCALASPTKDDTRSGLQTGGPALGCFMTAKIDCPLRCSEIDFDAVCDATLGAACDGQCGAEATGTCLDHCSSDCEIGCQANGDVSCQVACDGKCDDNCRKLCAGAWNSEQCNETCQKQCDSSCQQNCYKNVDSSCNGTCKASCDATCSVEAHVACQIKCSVDGFTTCKAKVAAQCVAECSSAVMLTCTEAAPEEQQDEVHKKTFEDGPSAAELVTRGPRALDEVGLPSGFARWAPREAGAPAPAEAPPLSEAPRAAEHHTSSGHDDDDDVVEPECGRAHARGHRVGGARRRPSAELAWTSLLPLLPRSPSQRSTGRPDDDGCVLAGGRDESWVLGSHSELVTHRPPAWNRARRRPELVIPKLLPKRPCSLTSTPRSRASALDELDVPSRALRWHGRPRSMARRSRAPPQKASRFERARRQGHESPVHSSSPRSCTTERGTGRQPLRMPRLRSAYERSCWHSHDAPALSTALILALYRVHRSARHQPPLFEHAHDSVRRASISREESSVPRSRSE